MTIARRSVLAGLAAATIAAPAALAAPASGAEGNVFSAEAFAAAQHAGKPILIDVAAPWCPICKRQQPLLQAILSDARYRDVQRFNIDFDTQKDALRLVGARMQSTLICYKGGREVGRSIGQTQREWLEDQLEKLL